MTTRWNLQMDAVAEKTAAWLGKYRLSKEEIALLSSFFGVWAGFCLMPGALVPSLFAAVFLLVAEVLRRVAGPSEQGVLGQVLNSVQSLILIIGLTIGTYQQVESMLVFVIGMVLLACLNLIILLPEPKKKWPLYLVDARTAPFWVIAVALLPLGFVGWAVFVADAIVSLLVRAWVTIPRRTSTGALA